MEWWDEGLCVWLDDMRLADAANHMPVSQPRVGCLQFPSVILSDGWGDFLGYQKSEGAWVAGDVTQDSFGTTHLALSCIVVA